MEAASRLNAGDDAEARMVVYLEDPRPHFGVNHYVQAEYLEGVALENLISERIRNLFDHVHKNGEDPGGGVLDAHFELVDFFDGLLLLELFEEGRQSSLRGVVRLENVDHLGFLVVLITLFIQGEIGQVHKRLLEIISVWLLVLFCAESREPFISYVSRHLPLVYSGYDYVNPHVKFEAAHEERIIDVSLNDHFVLQGVRYTFQVLEDLDLCSLRAALGLCNIGVFRMFLLVFEETIFVLRKNECLRHKIERFLVYTQSEFHHLLKQIFSTERLCSRIAVNNFLLVLKVLIEIIFIRLRTLPLDVEITIFKCLFVVRVCLYHVF